MMHDVEIDFERMEKDFSERKTNIQEIIGLNSVVERRRNMIVADSNDYMQSRERVLKSLERNMFTQEMKLMAMILTSKYGNYWDSGQYYIHYRHYNQIIKDPKRRLCLISSHGLHLTLSSLNE
jgi:hypothetical protein